MEQDKKILIVTEEPNSTAARLSDPKKLFDIQSNPFCQFLGRLFFGLENDRVHFNAENFLWKHANGSAIYGDDKNEDGKDNIRKIVKEIKLKMIVLFGKHALKIISDEKLQLKDYLTCSPVPLKYFLAQFKSHELDYEINKCTPIAVFPHPSGQAANAWMNNWAIVCNCLTEVQRLCNHLV